MLKFGFCLPIFAWPGARLFRTPAYPRLDAATTMRLGRLAEELGYHSLWVADHLMLGRDEAILEGWTTLCALAGMTRRAQLGVIHYNNAFRYPALTAKMAATLDQISSGRYIHFIDYGNQPREFLAYGLHPDDAIEERIAQMVEGLELTLRLWSAHEPVTFTGRYYAVAGAVCEPKPMQRPHPPIWIGEAHPMLLDAAARYADAWNSVPVGFEALQQRLANLRAACARAGRNYDAIEKTYEVQILIAPDRDGLRRKLGAMLALIPQAEQPADVTAFVRGEAAEPPAWMRETWLIGVPDEVEAQIRRFADLGVTHFMLWFVDAPDESGMRLFAETVMMRA
ncbi:MAG: LLM class flavin-dependent oxidoreductase [Anaerolineae bacterium]|nr:LLM class flavin-dependent oxidoreductase [Candidatus Roseilinea sp.]MDW8448590.1 LLM class flavin-dependent oxidoreductase [Anaerolineae bacterium]